MNADFAQRLTLMAAMQIEHNLNVHPQWQAQGHEYFRAVWVECAELLDHYGWKWWKHQPPDLDQVRLEIVDIWHFGLSELIRAGRMGSDHCDEDVVGAIEQGLLQPAGDFRSSIERLAAGSLSSRGFDVDAFVAVLVALPMSFDELFEGYVGKNVLNNFRQAHGYQSGDYQKLWGGREDNEHLVDLVASLDPGGPSFMDDLTRALESRYRDLCG